MQFGLCVGCFFIVFVKFEAQVCMGVQDSTEQVSPGRSEEEEEDG